MLKNGIKAIWQAEGCVANGWLSLPNAFSAEIMAAQGYDSVTIDMQHGMVGFEAAFGMLQAMRASGITPLVRAQWLSPGPIMQALDAGAYGVICPMINTRQEAETLVSYVRYPPAGIRSFGPGRAVFSAGANYWSEANDEVVCLAMIETQQAMDNLADIIATPGLDGVYIGPADLTYSLQQGALMPAFDRREPVMIDAIHKIIDAAKAGGKRVGLHTGAADYAAEARGWGVDLVTLSNDVRLLADAAAASVSAFRRGVLDQEADPTRTAY
jgi:4-hydroxy-2-oxoheptanedioate aldolase